MLKSEVLQNSKLDLEVSRYLTAILEYISMEILKLAVHYVIKIPHHCITRQDIKAAISIDKVRHNLLVLNVLLNPKLRYEITAQGKLSFQLKKY